MMLRTILPHGLVVLRDIAGSIYRIGGKPRWQATLTALDNQSNWEWRWSHLSLFPPGTLRALCTVVDGGANDGSWTRVLLRYANPERVLVVEPNPEMASALEDLKGGYPSVFVHPAALGEKASTLPFYLTSHSHNGSLLRPEPALGDGIRAMVEVPVITVDELTQDWKTISLLKLDLQGAELAALKGARQALQKTDFVFIEVNFQRQYQEMALFPEIHGFLDTAGFELVDLAEPYRADSRVVWADALYRRR